MTHLWRQITPLSKRDREIDLMDVDSLKDAWLASKRQLIESSRMNLQKFEDRLARQWSIETGILERIYELDRGTTAVLIEMGFVADLIERSSTNREPVELVQILRDHRIAIDLIQDCVANARKLSIGLINELHAVLTKHQSTVDGIDQFGNAVSFPLKHGKFKDFPNNPTRDDGTTHEYCPVVHVDSEMENLVRWYNECDDVNPILLAAWLHHRFTQIHPYQDGNGRVARALVTLVLIKHDLFPVVITRDQRPQYISALEEADAEKLKPLTRLFAEIEKKTILEAISLPPDNEPETSTAVLNDVTNAIASKLRRRRDEVRQKLRVVNSLAEQLQALLQDYLRNLANSVVSELRESGSLQAGIHVMSGGPDQLYNGKPTEHWYHYQVYKTAQETNQRVNFDENHYFVRARISGEQIPWLTFVISFHHVGQELSGVMEVTAFAEILYPRTEDTDSVIDQIRCMDKPFTMTNKDDAELIQPALLDWASECFTLAVKSWGDVL